MSGDGKVRLNWRGGEHEFHLRLGEIRALQNTCDAGPGELHDRMVLGKWRVDEIRETVRLALIGGGMEPKDAQKLVELHVDVGPWTESALLARALLASFLTGVPDDPVGKLAAGNPALGSPEKTES